MTLSYVEKGTDSKKQVTVSFDPPLSAYEEVKPRLLDMKLDAEEALGMVGGDCLSRDKAHHVLNTHVID